MVPVDHGLSRRFLGHRTRRNREYSDEVDFIRRLHHPSGLLRRRLFLRQERNARFPRVRSMRQILLELLMSNTAWAVDVPGGLTVETGSWSPATLVFRARASSCRARLTNPCCFSASSAMTRSAKAE